MPYPTNPSSRTQNVHYGARKSGSAERPKVYLIGVDHFAQWNRESDQTRNFINYLGEQIKQHNISFIGEEFSEEALEMNSVKSTTTQDIAKQYGIKHRFCDPDTKTRKELGIPLRQEIKDNLDIKSVVLENSAQDKQIKEEQRTYHPVREQFWLDKIKNEIFEKAIFVCGSEHLNSFKSLLERGGYNIFILNKQSNFI